METERNSEVSVVVILNDIVIWRSFDICLRRDSDKMLSTLLFDGIPPSLRGFIWQKLIGNDSKVSHFISFLFYKLQISPDVYSDCCLRAERGREGGAAAVIAHDLPRTFPHLSFFHDGIIYIVYSH